MYGLLEDKHVLDKARRHHAYLFTFFLLSPSEATLDHQLTVHMGGNNIVHLHNPAVCMLGSRRLKTAKIN